ncbi:MAG: hypothetical protein WC565_06975 [Parcubacteria group bacterium]
MQYSGKPKVGGTTALAQREDDGILALTGSSDMNRGEIEVQLDAAARRPRSIAIFMRKAMELATMDQSIAEACIYSTPRGGEVITGPSIRLAEIAASQYGNLHLGARIVEVADTYIVAQGVVWDLEANVRISTETRRRITTKEGRRYNEDMIMMTGNAAASIALRNAIFRIVPGACIKKIYQAARTCAVGDQEVLVQRRKKILGRLLHLGVDEKRVLFALNRASVDEITAADLEKLIGMGTAIKDGTSVDDLFPLPGSTGPTAAAEKPAAKPEPAAATKPVEPEAEPVAKSEPAPEPEPPQPTRKTRPRTRREEPATEPAPDPKPAQKPLNITEDGEVIDDEGELEDED